MKLVYQLPLAIGAVLLAASAASLFGVLRLNEAANAYVHVIEVDDAQERQATGALVDFKTQVQDWKDILLRGRDPEQFDNYWADFQRKEQLVRVATERLVAALPPGEARAMLERFNVVHREMGVSYRRGLALFKASAFDPTVGDTAVKGIDREPAKLLDESGDKIIERTHSAIASANETRRSAMLASLLAISIAVLAGIAGAVLFSLSITRKLGGEPEDARRAAREIATGNLDVYLQLQSGDTDSLMAAMNSMASSLKSIVGQVRNSSDSIATGSAQIATGNCDLSQRTEEQASALEQTAASMEQLGATVRQNADNAREANRLAAQASSIALQGGQVVGQVVETMRGIDESSRRIAEDRWAKPSARWTG